MLTFIILKTKINDENKIIPNSSAETYFATVSVNKMSNYSPIEPKRSTLTLPTYVM